MSEANLADNFKLKDYVNKVRCNKYKKMGHYARECRNPELVIDKQKGRHKKDNHFDRGNDNKKKDFKCQSCNLPGRHTKDCRSLKDSNAHVAKKEQMYRTKPRNCWKSDKRP